MYVSQEVRVAARSVGSQYREQFAHGIFPDPAAIPPTGSLERVCHVLWHNRPPDGLGTFSRTDDVGNFKAAAYGAVPSDVLPGQTSRVGEDYAAAMAGHIKLDPLTLHIDCEDKALGAQGPRAHVWNRLLVSQDEVRAVKVKGHATQRDVEAGRTSHLRKRRNDFADTFAKKGADTHKPAFRVARTVVACASLAKQARPRARPPRARLKRTRQASAELASGQVCDWLSPIVPTRFS